MVDVSIIVPVYKVEKYIRPSVESMLAQSHENIEVILVDDGSPDGCPAICDAFARQDPRVKVIHKQNEGSGMARNSGMDAAQGKYLFFCDPDDIMERDLVRDNYALAEKTNADIVVFGYANVIMEEDGSLSERREELPLLSGTFDYQGFWAHFREETAFLSCLWTRLFRAEHIRRHHLRSTSLSTGQDSVFLYDICGAPFQTIAYNPKAYYLYINHRQSAVTSYKPERMRNHYEMSRKFDQMVSGAPIEAGRYDDLIDASYLIGLNRSLGNLIECSDLSMRQMTEQVRTFIAYPEMNRALARAKLRWRKNPKWTLKVFLLRHRMVYLAVGLSRVMKKGLGQ